MLFLIVAAALLGGALAYHDGAYHPKAILWVSAALVLCIAGNATLRKFPRLFLLPVMGICLALNFWKLRVTPIPKLYHVPPAGYAFFLIGLAIAAIFIVVGFAGARSWWFAAAVGVHFVLSLWILRVDPKPDIDVWNAQMQSSAALMHGTNPYAIRIAVAPTYNPDWYGPGMVENGFANFGYPYPPVTLLLAIPGYSFFGDIRFSQLFALTATALLLGFGFSGLIPKLAACLYLFSPREFYVLEMSWTEPFLVLLLAATLVTAVRRPRLLWLPLGLFLASKQYMVLAVPLIWLLVPRIRDFVLLLGKAGAVILAVTLPLFLWNPSAFWSSAVALQLHQPFRMDALSLAVTAVHFGWAAPPAWVGFLLAATGIAVALWRNPRTPSGFAAAVALVLFLFVVFNKQAFANYYSFVIGALCAAIAAGSVAVTASAPRR